LGKQASLKARFFVHAIQLHFTGKNRPPEKNFKQAIDLGSSPA
jgi:hypothetical protein